MAPEEMKRRAWSEIRAMEGEFTIPQIAEAIGTKAAHLRNLIEMLLREGYVERRVGEAVYRLVAENDPGPDLPSSASQRAEQRRRSNMWRTLRQTRSVTAIDLSTLSSAGGVKVSERMATAYLLALTRAGYLRRISRAPATYRLLKNTGPQAPVLRQVQELFDPNKEQIVWSSSEAWS